MNKRSLCIMFGKHFRKVFMILSCCSLLLILGGCSLAVEDGDGIASRDRLVGAMVTQEEIVKTYGTVNLDGDKITELIFADIDGIYGIYNLWMEDGESPVYGSLCLEGAEVSNHYSVLDSDEKETEQKIEVHIGCYGIPDNGEEELHFYMNPIYLTKDNRIYAAPGGEVVLNMEAAAGGASAGKTITEEETLTLRDQEMKASVNVSADFYIGDRPLSITFMEMDEAHKVVKRTEYIPGELPDEYRAEEETAYILVETKLEGLTGEKKETLKMCSWDGRTMHNPEDLEEEPATFLQTDYDSGYGFLLKDTTWVIWAK